MKKYQKTIKQKQYYIPKNVHNKMDVLSEENFCERNKVLNDPLFAVCCQFLEKFSDSCGLETKVDTEDLLKWLVNSDEGK